MSLSPGLKSLFVLSMYKRVKSIRLHQIRPLSDVQSVVERPKVLSVASTPALTPDSTLICNISDLAISLTSSINICVVSRLIYIFNTFSVNNIEPNELQDNDCQQSNLIFYIGKNSLLNRSIACK